MYTTDRANADVNENVHIMKVQQFHEETDEKYFHWAPIINTNIFLRQLYFRSTRVSVC